MRRSPFFAPLAIASLGALFLPAACTEHTIVHKVQGAPSPGDEDAGEGEETPDAGPLPTSEPGVIDLGTVSTGVDIPVEIPEGALGFNVFGEVAVADFDPSTPIGIERIVAPDGTIVHDDFMPVGGSHETSVAAFDSIATASVPQSEKTPKDLTGSWKVRFSLQGSTSKVTLKKAKVRIQTSGDGKFHGGTLDLHIHLPPGVRVGGSAVNPATAETSSVLKQRIDMFYELTSTLLGIERGTVKYSSVAPGYVELDDDEIIKGFGVSGSEKEGTQALHILFTNAIRAEGEVIAVGIAPGIPGVPNLYGRGVSGIIVASMDNGFGSGPLQDALTMLHEAGHFIGLNHTTELQGGLADPLSDTPKCAGISMSGSALMSCPDRSNIMFALSTIDGSPELSDTQVRVYQGSPIYKAVLASAQTQSFRKHTAPAALTDVNSATRRFHRTGRALTPVESALSAGFCGMTPLDPQALVDRVGAAQAEAQLRAAAADPDLAEVIRGRARLSLKRLGL